MSRLQVSPYVALTGTRLGQGKFTAGSSNTLTHRASTPCLLQPPIPPPSSTLPHLRWKESLEYKYTSAFFKRNHREGGKTNGKPHSNNLKRCTQYTPTSKTRTRGRRAESSSAPDRDLFHTPPSRTIVRGIFFFNYLSVKLAQYRQGERRRAGDEKTEDCCFGKARACGALARQSYEHMGKLRDQREDCRQEFPTPI